MTTKRFTVALAALFVAAPPVAAQVAISALPAATTPLAGTEVSPIVQSGTTKKATASSISAVVLGIANTWTNKQTFPASSSGSASINLPAGTAPTSPVNGDCWTTTAGLFCRINGSTVGPYGIAGGSGTVTSVAVSGGSTGLTTSGGPVTGSGTITLAGTLSVTNGGTGTTGSTGSGNVVLSSNPTLVTPNLGLPSAVTLTNAVGLPLGSAVTGTLPVGNGGTGQTAFSANRLLKGNGSSPINVASSLTEDGSGNLGVGTSSPVYRLDVVSGDTTAGYAARLRGDGTTQKVYLQFTDNPATTERGRIGYDTGNNFTLQNLGNDNLRIEQDGTTFFGQNAKAVVIGSGTVRTLASGGYAYNSWSSADYNAFQMVINGGEVGTIHVTGTGTAYNTTSDARLKKNIADADPSGALIDALKVRQFDWRAVDQHQRYGFVAQELAAVYPEAVTVPDNADDPANPRMRSVDYSKMVPLLVKEIQALRARVSALETVH